MRRRTGDVAVEKVDGRGSLVNPWAQKSPVEMEDEGGWRVARWEEGSCWGGDKNEAEDTLIVEPSRQPPLVD